MLVTSGACLYIGCSDDDVTPDVTPSDAGPSKDAAGDKDAATVPDSGTTPDAGPARPPLFAYAHASPNLGSIYVCSKFGGVFAPAEPQGPVPPLAAFPLPLSDADALAFQAFPSQDIIILADDVTPLADGGLPSCAALTNGTAGVPASSIFTTPLVPGNTFKSNASYLIALVGCSKGADGGAAQCGSDYTGTTSTVREVLIELDRGTKAPADAIGGQFVHLSPELQTAFPTGVQAAVGVPADAAADGAPQWTYSALGSTVSYVPNPTKATPSTAVPLPGALKVASQTMVSLFESGGVPTKPLGIDFPLDLVGLFTTGDPDASATFKPAVNFTFVLLGDPSADPEGERGLRVVAVPNTQ